MSRTTSCFSGALLFLVASFAMAGDPCQLGGETNCTNCMFHVEDATLLAGSTGQIIDVLATNDVCLFGYSVGVQVDANALLVQAATNVGTVAENADFFSGGISVDGESIGFGVVFDVSKNFGDNGLAPGAGSVILSLTVDVVADTDTTTAVSFGEVSIPEVSPAAIKNVMTNVGGGTIKPALQAGTITIETRLPVIESIDPSQGFEGQMITITGQYFDEGGADVTICGQSVGANVVNATTIEVTAPACAVGPTDVEVCTVRGCDTATGGFRYLVPGPEISGFEGNTGPAGTQFTVIGANFDEPGLVVNVCDLAAAFDPPTDGGTRILVTAPECGVLDCVEVEVCTDGGCAKVADGYCFEAPAPVITGFEGNSGPSGTQFTVLGENFNFPDLVVRVGGVEAAHEAPAPNGTSVVVTAPACDAAGFVSVEVCTVGGCDSEDDGFECVLGIAFKRGNANGDTGVDISDPQFTLNFLFLGGPAPVCEDAADSNDDGAVNISDAQFVLNFLFLGGPPPPAPGNLECGLDPSDDILAECEDPRGACSG